MKEIDNKTLQGYCMTSQSMRNMSRLYAFGSNGSGQLGIGTTEDTSSPQRCLCEDTNVLPGQISRIVAGGNHTLALLEHGEVYSPRASWYGGRDGHYDSKYVFQNRLPLSSLTYKLCSALWEASVIVDEEDNVFSHGKGSKGELGTGAVEQPFWQKVPISPPEGNIIVDLASGVGHTVVVLSNGEAYGWGNGRKGQIGEPAEIVKSPRKIQNLDFPVKRAVCGREFTCFVGEATEGRYAVLGSNKWNVKSDAPSAVPNWTEVGASWGSIFVLKADGSIVSWGRNDHGQLAPRGLPNIKRMAVGSEHVLALANAGTVLSWGWGEHGNCGPDTDEAGDVKDTWNEILVQNESHAEIVGVSAGCATSFVWTKTEDKDSRKG